MYWNLSYLIKENTKNGMLAGTPTHTNPIHPLHLYLHLYLIYLSDLPSMTYLPTLLAYLTTPLIYLPDLPN